MAKINQIAQNYKKLVGKTQTAIASDSDLAALAANTHILDTNNKEYVRTSDTNNIIFDLVPRPFVLTDDNNVFTDTNKFTGDLITHNVYPETNNTYNLGSSTLKYKNIYATNLYGNIELANPVKFTFGGSCSSVNFIYNGQTLKQYNSDGSSTNLTSSGGVYILPINANKLSTARTISFVKNGNVTTDVTGSFTFDGSADVKAQLQVKLDNKVNVKLTKSSSDTTALASYSFDCSETEDINVPVDGIINEAVSKIRSSANTFSSTNTFSSAATFSSTVATNGTLTTVDIKPKTTNAYSIGTASLQYKDIYATNLHGNLTLTNSFIFTFGGDVSLNYNGAKKLKFDGQTITYGSDSTYNPLPDIDGVRTIPITCNVATQAKRSFNNGGFYISNYLVTIE